MIIRPLTEADIPAIVDVIQVAMPLPEEWNDGSRAAWLDARTRHLLEHHGDGCWVAEDAGMVVGGVMALVEDGIWGLSMLAVAPDVQAAGIGRQLLTASLRTAEGSRGGLIMSSQDPKAMRLYALAGFHLRPCVALAGIVDRSAIPAGLRARPSEDLEAAVAMSARVRGGRYGLADLAMQAGRAGYGLLAIDGRGFVVHREDGSPAVLCATDDEAATDLLWSCWATGPNGGSVHVDAIMAGQDWAVRAGLQARLALSPEGPMYTRGELGPLRPWLPSGAFL